ncbi:MAG: metallophosphoesterase, partial [Desulfobacteraceae bacterium]|nr:metallophosphoesterase [Desulfobacteraceae bacterium]
MSDNSDSETQVCRRGDNTCKPLPYIKARILWPALGFPEVVAPKNNLSMANGTNAIEMLLFSKKANLNSQDVAKHLRYVTWKERHCRYLNPDITKCSFSSSEMEVKRVYPKSKNDLVEEVHFCSGHVVAGLSKFVREFYDKVGIKYLFQVRIYESASAKLNPGLYNLFWINNNKNAKPEKISIEMEILKKHFAEGREPDGTWWRGTYPKPFIHEYEYDYGKPPAANSRTEVLHPLFVWGAESTKSLKIGHLTDPHVCLRSDMFEINLKTAKVPVEQYNNYNTRFMEFYFQAKQACDVLLLTGDIIDYGRGYKGRKASLNDDNSYQLDRNWFLLYSLIASGGDKYQKPMYTVLGNHDWRLHPYGPVSSF